MTDLSNAEIVLDKLAVRLVPVLGLIAGVVPLAALASLQVGVDPLALFGLFLTYPPRGSRLFAGHDSVGLGWQDA